MGVSRLDSFTLLNVQVGNTTGANTATEKLFTGPCNGLITILASGGFGAGTLVMEVADGLGNWVDPVTSPASLAGPGALVWQGAALGVRAKLTGSTNPTLTAVAILIDR